MGRYKKRGLTREEKFGWALATAVFVVWFVIHFTGGVFSNCIFEWPPRWDIKTCLSEQVGPAKEKAAEKAVNFIP